MAEDLMYREKAATVISASVMIGSVMEYQSPMTYHTLVDWLASKLKTGREIANTWMRIRPRKNDALVATLSPRLLRLTAWKMPSGSAISTAITSEIPDR